jgi:iron complex outermembrane receptor protein
VGVDLDRMREDRQGYLNSGGVAGALKRDEDNLVRNRDLFVQAGWDLTGSVALDAGMRRSSVRFRTEDHFIIAGPPANPDDSGSLSYTATSPVLGLTWRVSPELNVYGNVGRGFETPTFTELAYRSGGLTGLNTELKAGRSRHAEVGAKWRLNPAQRLDLAVFDIRTTDDLVVDSNTGGRTTYRNATRTRRSGVEAGWSATWGPTLSSQVSATVLRAVFDAPFTSGTTTVPAGNRLPGVPAHNAFAGLDWRPAQAWGGFNGGVELVRQGRIAVNDANSDAAPAATLLNLRAGFGQRVGGWDLRQDLRLENATDARYAGSVIVNEGNQRFFEPAMPRSVMLRLSATVRP